MYIECHYLVIYVNNILSLVIDLIVTQMHGIISVE